MPGAQVYHTRVNRVKLPLYHAEPQQYDGYTNREGQHVEYGTAFVLKDVP
jgi:hypothetical protein